MQAQYAYCWYNPTNPTAPEYTTPDAWENDNTTNTIKLTALENAKENNLYANRVSIYASPGTQILINNKIFIVGHSGILELGDNNNKDLLFKEISLQKIKTVELDKEATKNKIENGVNQISLAISYLLDITNATIAKIEETETTSSQLKTTFTSLGFDQENLEAVIINSETVADYFSQFKNDFDIGYNEYIQGRRGIYKATGTNYIPLQNIIIDVNYITLE